MMKKIILSLYRKSEGVFSNHDKLRRSQPFRSYRRYLINYVTKNYRSDFVEIDGHKIFLDENDSLRLSLKGSYGKFETEFLKNEIKKGDTVLDLGANIGYYTLLMARLVGKEGKVYAFEPEPDNFELLTKNVKTNGYTNVVLEQKAVSNKSGKVKLFLSEEHKSDHQIIGSTENRNFVEVDAVSLDDYFNNSEQISFIKSNIQGAEGLAIQGMSDIFRRSENMKMIVEFFPLLLKNIDVEPSSFLEMLSNSGFSFYEINSSKYEVKSMNSLELLQKYTPEKQNGTGIVCVKGKLPRF